MKTIKVKFYVSTNYVGSAVEEIVEIEVDEDASENEIESDIQAAYEDWLSNNTEREWTIIE